MFNDLFLRDGSICGICKRPFDMLHFNSREVHVDHIKPVAAGGSHEMENLQLAHANDA